MGIDGIAMAKVQESMMGKVQETMMESDTMTQVLIVSTTMRADANALE